MSTINKEKKTIDLPKDSVKYLLSGMRSFEMAQEEIEDFLISRDKTIITKLKKARDEHLNGEVKKFQNLLNKYV